MPANLPPDYIRVEQRYREATTPEEKVEHLQEMLAIIPKHKGTDHLRADLRKRLSQHRKESQQARKKGARTSSSLDHVEREGAGQMALVGAPNSGKSSIVAACTAAEVQVADYPFSTFRPATGMVQYEDIQIQLIDLPPITRDYTETWVYNIIRNVDHVLLTVDLSEPAPEEQLLECAAILEEHNLMLTGSRNATSPNLSVASKPVLVVATKVDADGADVALSRLQETYADEYPLLPLCVVEEASLADFRRRLFEVLEILRVYTKTPGHKPDMDQPYVLPVGSTVLDVAEAIHRDFADNLRYARIWGSEKYDGQQVKRDHVVQDRDILEIHA